MWIRLEVLYLSDNNDRDGRDNDDSPKGKKQNEQQVLHLLIDVGG